jgi:hypothetical protein
MGKRLNKVRAFALGLAMAALGFGYALATSGPAAAVAQPPVQSRSLGTTALSYTNFEIPPIESNLYDLGDACLGSVVTRYVTATGGIRPYRYQAVNLKPLLSADSTVQLYASGLLYGIFAPDTTPPLQPLSFNVQVVDSTGISPQLINNGLYNIYLYAWEQGMFRFGVDNVNNGVVGQNYIAKLETLGGRSPVVFSVVPNTVMVNGTAVASLEAIGLSLTTQGTLYGRPLQVGQVTFVAQAEDALNHFATGRTGSNQNQLISFNVADTSLTATDYTTLRCVVHGDSAKPGNDTVQFSGHINLNGSPISNLNGCLFAFRIGGMEWQGQLNDRGQVLNTYNQLDVFPDGTILKATVNSQLGTVAGSITHANLAQAIRSVTLTNGGAARLAVGVTVANTFSTISFAINKNVVNGFVGVVGSDMLVFKTVRSGTKYQILYKFSQIGQTLGGLFQVINTKAVDGLDIAGVEGDSWMSKFLLAPRVGVDPAAGLGGISQVDVVIGSNFDQPIPSSQLVFKNGVLSMLPSQSKAPMVSKFQFDTTNFRGMLQTNVLNASVTGIPAAVAAEKSGFTGGDAGGLTDVALANHNLGIDLTRGTNGKDFISVVGKQIFLPFIGQQEQTKGYWVDQISKR